jgi:hypothetical protein
MRLHLESRQVQAQYDGIQAEGVATEELGGHQAPAVAVQVRDQATHAGSIGPSLAWHRTDDGAHSRPVNTLALACCVAMLAGCAQLGPPVGATADRDSLSLEMSVRASRSSLVVETVVRNGREVPIHLVTDQCGRVTEVLLARTVFEPDGERWEGSLQAVKDLVLRDQLSRQGPDRFHPRIPGNSSAAVPECRRPEQPVTIGPGDEIAERWELPLDDMVSARVLSAVGSEGSVVRAEVVEARAPDEVEYLDIYAAGSADAEEARHGRSLRVETPAASVVQRSADPSAAAVLSLGQLFDRLVLDAELRGWIERQPADSWRYAQLGPASQLADAEHQQVHFRLVTTGYELAATVVAAANGEGVTLDLPSEADRTRIFPRSPGALPPGISLIREPEGPTLGDDISVGEVSLPSGTIAVGEYLFEDDVMDIEVAPGAYPAHATLARYEDLDGNSGEEVALASLVLSAAPTVRWQEAHVVAVDGGTTTFTSAEARSWLEGLMAGDEDGWWSVEDRIFESMTAHDYLATEWTVADGLNLVRFSSGYGDGGYPVYIGFDADGRPTRVVVDFYVLHLAWPTD